MGLPLGCFAQTDKDVINRTWSVDFWLILSNYFVLVILDFRAIIMQGILFSRQLRG